MRRDARNCSLTIAKISPSLWSDGSFGHQNGQYRSFILLFLALFIIYLTVKWFLTDFEWFTVSLKTSSPQVCEICPHCMGLKVNEHLPREVVLLIATVSFSSLSQWLSANRLAVQPRCLAVSLLYRWRVTERLGAILSWWHLHHLQSFCPNWWRWEMFISISHFFSVSVAADMDRAAVCITCDCSAILQSFWLISYILWRCVFAFAVI